MMPNRNAVIGVISFALLSIATASLAASPPPAVEKHNLQCGNVFPCPPEIRRRVDFWIKVFRTWNTNELVFHDRSHPARVYSVMQSSHTCSRSRNARPVERERKRIQDLIRTVAKKMTWAEPNWRGEEKAFLALFKGESAAEVKAAAERVRCQQGNRDRFAHALRRYGHYKDQIVKAFKAQGLSEEYVYLPFVESAYNPRAYSRAGAAGLWQIMPRTARVLGLQLNATMDERFDPGAATRGAAKYLSDSKRRLTEAAREEDPSVTDTEINPFIVTSYNYGVSGMKRAIQSVGPDYIKVLNEYKSRSFQTAVRNFYASFLAARHVAINAERYFDGIFDDRPPPPSQIVLKRPTSAERMARVFGVDQETLRDLNPALTRNVWKGWRLAPQGYTFNLPYRTGGWDRQVVTLDSLPMEQPQLSGKQYVVQRGDTACEIASIFKVRCKDLIQLNNLNRRAFIRVGQKLEIPGQPKPTATQRTQSARNGRYQVRRGDTACEIARSFKVSCRTLIRENNLGRKAVIHIGQTLVIPGLAAQPSSASATSPAEGAPTKGVGEIAASGGEKAVSSQTLLEKMERVDVSVRASQKNGKTRYHTKVLPEETLGHYADWLGIGGTNRIRKLNGFSATANLSYGQTIVLPVDDEDARLAFEAERLEYHRTLLDEFGQHFEVVDLGEYTVKRGDTLWTIAERQELPKWLLTRLNPDLGAIAAGDKVVTPVVRARQGASEPLVDQE